MSEENITKETIMDDPEHVKPIYYEQTAIELLREADTISVKSFMIQDHKRYASCCTFEGYVIDLYSLSEAHHDIHNGTYLYNIEYNQQGDVGKTEFYYTQNLAEAIIFEYPPKKLIEKMNKRPDVVGFRIVKVNFQIMGLTGKVIYNDKGESNNEQKN